MASSCSLPSGHAHYNYGLLHHKEDATVTSRCRVDADRVHAIQQHTACAVYTHVHLCLLPVHQQCHVRAAGLDCTVAAQTRLCSAEPPVCVQAFALAVVAVVGKLCTVLGWNGMVHAL